MRFLHVPAEAAPKKKKRSPWTWPLIALIVLLLVVLGGTVFALFGDGLFGSPEGSPTTPVQTQETPKPQPTTPAPVPTTDKVNIDSLELVGKTCDEAQAVLLAEGDFSWSCAPGSMQAPDISQEGRIYEVSPRGFVDAGTPITASSYGPIAAIAPPVDAPTFTAGGQPISETAPSSVVSVSWTDAICPAAAPDVAGYTVTLQNAVFEQSGAATGDFDAASSTRVRVSNTGGEASATYQVLCTLGDAAPRASEPSQAGTVALVTPPVDTPEPPPTTDPESEPTPGATPPAEESAAG